LNHWFDRNGVTPLVVAEFEDSALFKVFGSAGVGFFAGPTAIEKEIVRQYGVKVVGQVEGVTERFYAITMERKVSQPAVLAITQNVQRDLFGEA
jgi:LysR family transcriptional activator of nhaA